MKPLADQVILVTGASYGVGRAVAIGLARAGADVVLAATSADKLEETRKRVAEEGQRGIVCPTDISDAQAVDALISAIQSKAGKLNGVCACAFGHIGEDEGKSLLDTEPDELASFAQTSIVGNWLLTRATAPMIRSENGRYVFVIADWGFPQHNVFLGTPPSSDTKLGSEAFASAKHAITGLVNTIDRMLGVSATGIYPGIIASLRPSLCTGSEEVYFDIDDPVELIEAEEDYAGGWAIPLADLSSAVLFALTTHCAVKAILMKPPTPEYDGLHV